MLHSGATAEDDQEHRAQELSGKALQQRFPLFEVLCSDGISHVIGGDI